MNIQAYAIQHLTPGATVSGQGARPASYTVQGTDDRGFTLLRESGKTVRVTWRMVAETLARLQAGEVVKFQGNRSKGGIDGTSAKRDAVLAALQGIALRDGADVVLAEGAAARIARAG